MTRLASRRPSRPARVLPLLALVLTVGAVAPRGSVSAQPAARRALGLEDYYRLESVSSPAISPDGRRVAFVRTVVLEAENRRHSEIWMAPADGSAPPHRLTSPAWSASNPTWSPDGRLLAFTSRRPGPGAREEEAGTIWFLRMDEPAGEAFPIPGVTAAPIFSPDNRWIAMIRTVNAPRPREAPPPASAFERKLHERFKGHIYDWLNYRFDQRGYLPDPRDPEATPPRELLVVPREGGTPRTLTNLGVDVQSAAWRPDSRALVLVADTHQRDEYSYERADLFLVDLDGRIERLTDDGYDHSDPAWSPDGAVIVFRRQQSLNQILEAKQRHGSPVDVFAMRVGEGVAARAGTVVARSVVNLTSEWDDVPGPPRVSPDGRFVYFPAGVRGATHLFRVPLAGGAVEAVTRGDRRHGGFSFSADFARMAYTVETPVSPGDVYVASTDGQREVRVSRANQALLDEVELAPAERLAFASRDGTPVEGWILLPPKASGASPPFPAILTIHGGPHSAYGYEFSFQRQLWAAQGYAVLYTNPRGSTEYGERFLWATWGGWGNLDFDDVMAGVDAALTRYPLDAKRLGVTGYSYGGFLTNWIITHTTRFAAAIVGAGISNWISDYGTADIPRTKETEFFGPPWDPVANETLRRQSPIEYVARAETPTLFLHGETDFRVPIEQAEQMYTALKKRRVPAKFVRYPETSHGGWTPWNTVHRYYQELQWWRTWIGAPAATR
jgi:dipeptidyl aminopeptidase/acylaminoacyl peptidase